jgi:hypothetical protein
MDGVTPDQVVALIRDWAVPVLLIAVATLVVLRNSRREALRFGDAARVLSEESSRLETRLSVVNRELSLRENSSPPNRATSRRSDALRPTGSRPKPIACRA